MNLCAYCKHGENRHWPMGACWGLVGQAECNKHCKGFKKEIEKK